MEADYSAMERHLLYVISVTCHSTQVNVRCLNSYRPVLDLPTL